MTITLLVVVGVLSALLLTTMVLSSGTGFTGVVGPFFALGLAAFCGVGFLASFELSAAQSWSWHLAYAVIGTSSLVSALSGLSRVWNRKRQVEIR